MTYWFEHTPPVQTDGPPVQKGAYLYVAQGNRDVFVAEGRTVGTAVRLEQNYFHSFLFSEPQ